METEAVLKRWYNKTLEVLEKKKADLLELEREKEVDLKRYKIYSDKIEQWLKEDVSDDVREVLSFNKGWLNSHEVRVNDEMKSLEKQIKADEFIVDRLKQEL